MTETVENLERRYEDLLARIEDAAQEVESGRLSDFETLNKEIMNVCAETQSAEPAIAKALQKHMGRVILKLDELASTITAFKDRLQENGQ